jgi:hypothetical protein
MITMFLEIFFTPNAHVLGFMLLHILFATAQIVWIGNGLVPSHILRQYARNTISHLAILQFLPLIFLIIIIKIFGIFIGGNFALKPIINLLRFKPTPPPPHPESFNVKRAKDIIKTCTDQQAKGQTYDQALLDRALKILEEEEWKNYKNMVFRDFPMMTLCMLVLFYCQGISCAYSFVCYVLLPTISGLLLARQGM